jgi:hypothetical protein
MARQSTDGKTWSDASEVGALIGTEDVEFETGDALLAFARPLLDGQPTVVWRMSTIGVWQKIGEIDDYYVRGAYGPDGWIAVGANAVWLSPHGANWTRMPTRPSGGAAAVLPDKTGFVVTTAIGSGGGCLIDLGDFTGQTWTSVDGASWVKMRQEWYGRGLAALFALDRKLVGVGTAWEDGDSFGFVRTANLPLVQGVAGAVPSLAPSPTPEEGCGP